jgi:hypothetical protein
MGLMGLCQRDQQSHRNCYFQDINNKNQIAEFYHVTQDRRALVSLRITKTRAAAV